MALAKDVSAATYDFLLGRTGTLEKRDVLLACVAATAADGSARQTRECLIYALQRGVTPGALREALLEVAPLAGAVRAEQSLVALGVAVVEAEKPSDPFAQLLDPKERKVPPTAVASPDDEQAAGPSQLDAVHGDRASRLRARLASRSKALARSVEEDLYARTFARSGLTRLQRALVALGACFPLDAREQVADWVHAARLAGADDDSLWLVAETLARLFRESPEIANATAGFEAILGRRVRPLE
jgi:alkylhydroperoxidase/carboxymuconolactone decarboxylase family protein YurZ